MHAAVEMFPKDTVFIARAPTLCLAETRHGNYFQGVCYFYHPGVILSPPVGNLISPVLDGSREKGSAVKDKPRTSNKTTIPIKKVVRRAAVDKGRNKAPTCCRVRGSWGEEEEGGDGSDLIWHFCAHLRIIMSPLTTRRGARLKTHLCPIVDLSQHVHGGH